jgi:hypothetical protein
MSVDLYALSDRRLVSVAEWQQAIDGERSALVMPTDTSIDELDGFLPVRWNGMPTGFECLHVPGRAVFESRSTIDFGREWTHALAFYTKEFAELLVAYVAAAAYAKAAGGVVFDPQQSLVMSPRRAFEMAGQIERDIPKAKEAVKVAAHELARKRRR